MANNNAVYCLVALCSVATLTATWLFFSPETLPPECRLTPLENLTLFGEAQHVDERTSAAGNSYYLFDIVTEGGKCSYPAFSFQGPDGNTFPGVWKLNKFSQMQFEVSGGGLDKTEFRNEMLSEYRLAQQ